MNVFPRRVVTMLDVWIYSTATDVNVLQTSEVTSSSLSEIYPDTYGLLTYVHTNLNKLLNDKSFHGNSNIVGMGLGH